MNENKEELTFPTWHNFRDGDYVKLNGNRRPFQIFILSNGSLAIIPVLHWYEKLLLVIASLSVVSLWVI